MIKKILAFFAIVSFILPVGTFAQTSPTSDKIVNCFDYYKFGSVQVTAESETNNAVSGNKLNFIGTIKNDNPYPVVDGTVVVKIFRMQSEQNANGPYVVDQFIAKDNVNIDASSTKKFDFIWNVPAYAKSGDYQVATFFTSAHKFNLLGLTFTDDIVGNKFNFKVSGEQEKIVEFDKNSVKINNTPYFFAAFPPIVDVKKDGVITTDLLNETDQSQQVKVTWKTYWWDAQMEENLLDSRTENIDLNKGEKKNLTYIVTDNTHSVYLVVAEVDYKDTKSILGARFTREGIDIPRINFPAVTSFPLKKDTPTSVFSCLHNTNTADIENGSLSLKLEDSNGKVFHDFKYDGKITGAMMGVKDDFVPSQSYDKFSLVAEFSQNGKVIDTAKMDYDCKNIDPSKCLVSSKINIPVLIFLGTILIIGLIALFIFEKRRHKLAVAVLIFVVFVSSIVYLTFAFKAFGQTPTYDAGGGGSVVWSYNTNALYSFTPQNRFITFLSPTAISVQYNVTSSKLSGSNVLPGDTIRFTFSPQSDQDISWFGTGGFFDSPYGTWQKNAESTLSVNGIASSKTPPVDFNKVGEVLNTVSKSYYVSLTLNPPNKNIINTNGLSCGSFIALEGYGGYVDCTVLPVATATTINPTFNFGSTYGYFYVITSNPIHLSGFFGSKPMTWDEISTFSSSLHLRKLSNSDDSSFKLDIPPQNISYTFIVNQSSTTPAVENPISTTTSSSTQVVPICTPNLICKDINTITDRNHCKDDFMCGTPLTCSIGTCVNSVGAVINPLNQNVDGTTKLPVSIKSFVVSPNTINSGGDCNFKWTLNQYNSDSSICTVYDSSGNVKATYNPIPGISSTYTASNIKNETTYKITCGENVVDPVTKVPNLTGITTKYATCNINASFSETN